ncbi:MAG: HU family DNA-binding protein [Alistipes sp.]|jgi:DNA-binding protein HU-beta|nr:HU family DNA-binding protein [Alistipes sp.]MBQ2415336.1 HU family DNA-binding protein [Alistipes sp.]MBQ5623783.1 HU family DNA-binding protein [Alistipes sp.]MBQ5914011.1 HU family DNA-binding protein [Alistipes sp.]MBR5802232.1 HU family DNA-binding protein [Alistipes sp.]
MNKSQLINDLAEQSQLSKVEVKRLVDTLFEKIESKLQEGEKVVLSGFGVFSVVNVAERVGRNPRTGEQVKIAPRRTVRFRPTIDLKQ